MNQFWNGKLVLITGASSGIGAITAKKLASEGLRIILVSRQLEKLNEVAELIRANGGTAYCFPCDLTIPQNRISLVTTIKSELGVPDIIINNAGIGWYGYFYQMPWLIAEELIELNIVAPTHLTSLFLPDMLLLKKGRIINIGSIAGKLPEQGIALYSASKAYLDGFSSSLYRELRGTHLTVSVLRAGAVKTSFFDNASELQKGGRIPAESLAIMPDRISNKVWYLIQHPHRYIYVPFYLSLSPALEVFFSWALDIAGPVLLRRSQYLKK